MNYPVAVECFRQVLETYGLLVYMVEVAADQCSVKYEKRRKCKGCQSLQEIFLERDFRHHGNKSACAEVKYDEDNTKQDCYRYDRCCFY